ncbi:ATP-binding protein [Streptomyces sp. NPDC055078]
MIEIPELAIVAAGTMSAFYMGSEILRSRRQRARQREEIETLRARLDAARQEADRAAQAFTAEVVHLSQERVPAAATRAAHPHIQVPGPLNPDLTGSEFGAGLDGTLAGLGTAMTQERKRVDAAARAGMRGATREIQAGLYRLQDVLRGLQQRYDDPELAQTLYALDHENEQSLRRAQVAAVVCGAWVGLAREESHLVDAVTGGQSRIVGYHRVQINNHLEDGTALVSHAVEPVAIIIAELLDNALRHSSPDTTVTVNLERAHHGVTATVDDAGVGMAADERAYAQRMVAGRDPILLSELGDPPRMGLAAIGQLTRQFDLSVDLSSPSPYGGVRAVLLVKNHLLSHLDPAQRPPAASAPHSTRGPAAPAPDPGAQKAPSPRTSRADRMDRADHPSRTDRARADRASRTDRTGRAATTHTRADRPSRTASDGARTPARPAADPGRTPPRAPSPENPGRTPGPPGPPGLTGLTGPAASAIPTVPAAPAVVTRLPSPAPGDGSLPRRRRRVRAADPAAGPAPTTTPTRSEAAHRQAPALTPEEAAAALGALQAGTAAARNTAEPEGNAP